MNFEPSQRTKDFQQRLIAFMDEHVYPAEEVHAQELAEAGSRHAHSPVMEELKAEARQRGLWNLFLPDAEHGAGLTNLEYAPLAEIMGRTKIAAEACNCNAPDTGNMEVLHEFGTEDQKGRWLRPLLGGEIRSGFAMSEPDVASSDATNIGMRIEREGDEYVLNGHKWWTTGALHPNCRILVVMGKTDPLAPTYQQQSMILCPLDAPGVSVERTTTIFGYTEPEGHGVLTFEDVRVPASNILAGEGMGFLIAQARLGPGRIHHCMRAIGAAERALELMCERADHREAFGHTVSHYANVRDWIAESRIELEMCTSYRWPARSCDASASDAAMHAHRHELRERPARRHSDTDWLAPACLQLPHSVRLGQRLSLRSGAGDRRWRAVGRRIGRRIEGHCVREPGVIEAAEERLPDVDGVGHWQLAGDADLDQSSCVDAGPVDEYAGGAVGHVLEGAQRRNRAQ